MLASAVPLLTSLLTISSLPPQVQAPAGRIQPIRGALRDAGTVDVTTGRWRRPGGDVKAPSQVVFNNTCTSFAVGPSHMRVAPCEDLYDEGRIPSPSAMGAPAGAMESNRILSFQVAYCTYAGPVAALGGYDMEVAFWNQLGGTCVGVTPPTPPPISSTATAYFDLAGLGLPGSTAVGFPACWTVTLDTSNVGFTLMSDGDGAYDLGVPEDSFNWSISPNQYNAPFGGPGDGIVIAAEPMAGGYGTCSYAIPCSTDSWSGQSCGTGLDTFDAVWINVDGIGVGSSSQPANCPGSVAGYGYGTNCYWMRGYPSSAIWSLWLVLTAEGPEPQVLYCSQSQPTSVAGCAPSLTVPNTSLVSGSWDVAQLPLGPGVSTSIGLFVYTHGIGQGPSTFSADVPFGTLCLTSFLRSAPTCAALTFSGTSNTCAASVSLAAACSGGTLGLKVGEDVNVQFWYRDPPSAPGAHLTNAAFYTLH